MYKDKNGIEYKKHTDICFQDDKIICPCCGYIENEHNLDEIIEMFGLDIKCSKCGCVFLVTPKIKFEIRCRKMIKQYYLNYDCGMAKIKIEVDTNILTTEAAKEIADFYDLHYFSDSGAIRAVVKLCAMDVIKAGVLFGDNLTAIKKHIKENNEPDLLGDKSGIKIIDFNPFQFEEVFLDIEDLDSEDIEDIEE